MPLNEPLHPEYRRVFSRAKKESDAILNNLLPITFACMVIIGMLNYFVEDALLPPGPWDEIISTVLSIALVLWLISRFLRQLRGVEDERDATTAALVRREERLEGVVDNLSAAVFLKDMEGRFLLINKEFERVFGVKRRDVIGRTAGDSLPKAVAETLEPISREVMESKAARRTERTLVGADGASRSYLCVQFPVPDPEGDIHALGGIATDITTDK